MTTTCVDSHVHYYECFSLAMFFLAAQRNLFHHNDSTIAALLMTQTAAHEHPLEQLWQQADTDPVGGQLSEPGSDPDALLFENRETDRVIAVIPGRQVVTEEKLEVLALCTADTVVNGRSLHDTFTEIRSVGGVPVIPWGFGKWWTQRGQLVAKTLAEFESVSPFLLGDNGGRPTVWSKPKLFQQGESQGIPVIAGSDPLPISGQEQRVGSYGSILGGALDTTHPTRWVREQLLRLSATPVSFGERRSTLGFLEDQTRIRVCR